MVMQLLEHIYKIPNLNLASSTNINGDYSIENISKGELNIEFSAVGFLKVSKKLNFSKDLILNIVLKEDIQLLDEAVVIGYGTARTKDLTVLLLQFQKINF